jgi:hypothetical protein
MQRIRRAHRGEGGEVRAHRGEGGHAKEKEGTQRRRRGG